MNTYLIELLLLAAPNPSISWAVVLFFFILGLLATLSPSRRTSEVKKPKED